MYVWQTAEFSLMVDLGVAGLFVVFFVAAWPVLRPTYRLYCLVIMVASFFRIIRAVLSIHCFAAASVGCFPSLLSASGAVVRKSWQWLLIWSLELMGFLFLAMFLCD